MGVREVWGVVSDGSQIGNVLVKVDAAVREFAEGSLLLQLCKDGSLALDILRVSIPTRCLLQLDIGLIS